MTLLTRRALVKTLVASSTVAWTVRAAHATEPPKLEVTDPAARKLGYVENSGQIDAKKFPQFVAGSNCENCLQLQGKPGYNYRACNLFPGKLVSVSGWCSGWTAEM